MTRPTPRFTQADRPDAGRAASGAARGASVHTPISTAHVDPFDDDTIRMHDPHDEPHAAANADDAPTARRPLASKQRAPQNQPMSDNAASTNAGTAAGASAHRHTNGDARPFERASSVEQRDQRARGDVSNDNDDSDDHPHGEPLGPDDPLAPLPFNPYKGNRGLTRAWHAMKNSFAGFRVAIREESAFRQELTLAAILLPCGVLVPVDPVARVMLLGSVLLVLIVELLNSSVEAAIDRISLERHELSRRAKDLGSAAVMVALGMCVMTWALIVGPLIVHWVRGWF